MTMSNLHFVRHGFSLGNLGNWTGQNIGFQLTDEYCPLEGLYGVKQAQEAGQYLSEKLKGKKVLCYVSPYYRTRETLYHILKAQYPDVDIEIVEDKNIREIDQGLQFQSVNAGEFQDEVKYNKELKKDYKSEGHDSEYIPYLQGESIVDVSRRVRSFDKTLKTSMESGKYDDILVVAHNTVLKLLYKMHTGKDMGKLNSGSVISFEGEREDRFEPSTFVPKDYVSTVSYDNYLKLLSFQKEFDANKQRYSEIFGDRKLNMPLQEECIFIEKAGETLVILPGNNDKKGIFFIDTTFGQDNITFDKKSTSTYHVVGGKGKYFFKSVVSDKYTVKDVSTMDGDNVIVIPPFTEFYYESDPSDPLKLIEVMEPNFKEENVVVIGPTPLAIENSNIKH